LSERMLHKDYGRKDLVEKKISDRGFNGLDAKTN
jgi:hypothetical protein